MVATPDDYTDLSVPPAWCFSYGVTCGTIPTNMDYRRVTEIRVREENLRGGTLPVFSHLGEMTKLEISMCGISGTIPPSISIFSKLQKVKFRGNLLTGIIPSSLRSLDQLKELDLSYNKLSGTIPLLNQPSLLLIDFESNYLTMGSLTEVPSSTFSDNTLSGGIVNLRKNCVKFSPPVIRVTTPTQQIVKMR